jgi:hypothetical protein
MIISNLNLTPSPLKERGKIFGKRGGASLERPIPLPREGGHRGIGCDTIS